MSHAWTWQEATDWTSVIFSFSYQIKGKKLVIQNEDIAKGIAELVSKHGVNKLVMGAAADKHYSRYTYYAASINFRDVLLVAPEM
jgi:K+-sensing histidine kinase KdpD